MYRNRVAAVLRRFFFSIFPLPTVTQNFEFYLECYGYLIALLQ